MKNDLGGGGNAHIWLGIDVLWVWGRVYSEECLICHCGAKVQMFICHDFVTCVLLKITGTLSRSYLCNDNDMQTVATLVSAIPEA